MNRFSLAFLLVTFATLSHSSHASGQRTVIVTKEAIGSYKQFHPGTDSPETVLHYIGSLGKKSHLMMITKTALPPQVEARPGGHKIVGMPRDAVFTYIISAHEMRIINGWDITEVLDNGGFEVRPSYCPAIRIIKQQNEYALSEDSNIKKSCIEMINPRNIPIN